MLNVAARVITAMRKFDCGLSHLLHSELHWLDIQQRIRINSESQFIGASRIVLPSTWCTAACVVWCFQSSAPAVSQLVSVGRATIPLQQLRSSIVLHCTSNGLELISGFSSGPNAEHWQLHIGIRLTCSRRKGTRSTVAHYSHCIIRSTNPLLLLLLLLLPLLLWAMSWTTELVKTTDAFVHPWIHFGASAEVSLGLINTSDELSQHWRCSIMVRTLVLASKLSISCARLLAGRVTTLWLSHPLSVSQHGQLSHPSLMGQ